MSKGELIKMKQDFVKKAIATTFVGLSLAACGNTSATDSSSSNDSDQKADSVEILTSVTGGKDEAGMEAFEKKLSELAGYTVHMEKPASDYNQVLLQKLKAGGEGLDLIYFDQAMLQDLVAQGALLDITDNIKNSSVLGDTSVIPESEWNSIAIDNKLYASFNKKEIQRVVNINEALLKEYNLELPEETLAGYKKLFEELKEKNDSQGFYPLNTVVSTLFDFQPWFASKGLKGGIVVDKSGNQTVPWSSDEAVEVWEWLHELYAEGLIDPNALTDTTKELRQKFQSEQTAVVVDWAAWTGLYNANVADQYPNEFKAVAHGGTKTPDGTYMLTRGGASLWGIPASSDNVEGAMKVLETFATQEGGDLLSVGVEGYDYNIEDGKLVQTEAGKVANNDHGAPFPISEKYVSPTDYNPGVSEAMKLLQYASIESYGPDTAAYTEIVSKEAIKIIKGDISAKEGVKEMRDNLVKAKVIDK